MRVLKHTWLQDQIPKEYLKVFTTIKITKNRTFGCLRRTLMAVSILDAGKSCLCSITPFCNQQLQIQFAAKWQVYLTEKKIDKFGMLKINLFQWLPLIANLFQYFGCIIQINTSLDKLSLFTPSHCKRMNFKFCFFFFLILNTEM